MILRLTVVHQDGSPPRLVEVRAEPGHTVGELAVALGARSRTAVLTIGGDALPEDLAVGSPPLLDGAVVTIGPARGAGRSPATGPTVGGVPLVLTVVGGPDCGRALPLSPGRHRVGRSPSCDLVVDDPGISRVHAEVVLDRDGLEVRDLGTTNGSRVDGRDAAGGPVSGGAVRVRAGEEWRLGHSTLEVRPAKELPGRRQATGEGTLTVSPRPVVGAPSPPVRIDFPARPTPPRRRRLPWVVLVAPVPLAAALTFFFGPRMLIFALLSPLMMLGSVLGDRSTSRREHRDDLASWREQTARAAARVDAAVSLERRARLAVAPDPATVLAAAEGRNPRLWERRPGAPAYLHVRLGLGQLESTVEVQDGTAPERIRPPVPHSPVVVDLAASQVLGVVGPGHPRTGLARSLLGQLLVLHSPHELRISVVADDDAWTAPFAQAPHLRERSEVPASARHVGHEDAEVALAPLARHVASVTEDERRPPSGGPGGPTHLLVVDEPHRLRRSSHLRTILRHGPDAGVLVVTTAAAPDQLPHETQVLVTLADDGVTARLAGEDVATTEPWAVDAVGTAWATRVGAALVPLRDATPAPGREELPDTCRLVDLLDLDPDDPHEALGRWRRSEPGTLTVPVGVGGDGLAHLDLRADGPHALLAGTTGSGKSELLQTWVTSLALHLSPEQISFVLVDYKGGAAFADCAGLPHTVGVLTDLEPHHAMRALASLDAELTRRERLLAAAGAGDIDAYAGTTPLPRLLLVIDEFRMLAEQQPDVLARLIRIAAVGRSLGVHLVLATQRPGGIVSADVRANVSLRLSLRVRDRGDSDDVLGCPDAAAIPEDLPGRLLVGSGSGRPVVVQTARVGGRAPEAAREPLLVREVGAEWPAETAPGPQGPTDLQRLAASLSRAAELAGCAPPHRPWLPPLPATLTPDELPTPGPDGPAPFALVDVPEEQAQVPLSWAPASGHWMVVGGPRTGRTTTLRALVHAAAATWSIDHLHVQVVGDGSAGLGDLARLPHVGSVVDAGDRPVLRRFLARLRSEIDARREEMRIHGHADLDAWPADDPHRPPYLLLVVDGWARLVERGDPLDLEDVAETIEAVVRDGAAAGLRLVVSGGRELLTGRVAALVTRRVVHHLADRGELALAGVPKGVLPDAPVPGRAVLLPEGRAVQVALPGSPAGLPGRGAAAPVTGLPWRVAPLPTHVVPGPVGAGAVALGVGGPAAATLRWSPSADGRRLLVAGPPGSGRSSAARLLSAGLADAGLPTVLVAGPSGDRSPAGAGPTSPGTALRPEVHVLGADAHDELLALRREHSDLAVVVDDADRLDGTEIEEVLREIVRRVDRDQGAVVVTSTTSAATSQLRGLVAEVARGRAGVLLQPSARGDGDALGVRVPALAQVPGRGYVVLRGRAEEVQLAQISSAGVRGGASRREPVASKAQA